MSYQAGQPKQTRTDGISGVYPETMRSNMPGGTGRTPARRFRRLIRGPASGRPSARVSRKSHVPHGRGRTRQKPEPRHRDHRGRRAPA